MCACCLERWLWALGRQGQVRPTCPHRLPPHSGESVQPLQLAGPEGGSPALDPSRSAACTVTSPLSVSSQDYMRQAGEVTYADTHKGRKNEGVIEFRQYSDMKRALEKLDGTEVNGRKIRLIEDRPGARRRRSYSRSRSR